MKTLRFPRAILSSAALLIAAPLSHATLIGYWPLDDTAGDVGVAAIGGKDANWQNPGANLIWNPTGVIGGAAEMAGAAGGDYFTIDLNGSLNSTSYTIALWINPTANNQSYEGVFMVRPANGVGPDGDAAGNGNLGIAWESGDHLDTRANGAVDSAGGTVVADDITAGNNGWYHVAQVWDGVNGTQTQYINGIESGTGAGNVGTLEGGVWHLGNDSCCNGRQFNGLMDDVAVWDTALTPQQILELAELTISPDDIDPPTDSDGDGLPNEYELMFPGFLDPNVPDAMDDVDHVDGDLALAAEPDGLTNAEELTAGTDPSDSDTDDDGLLDGDEVNTHGTDPLEADSDGDTIPDGEEIVAGADGFVTDPNVVDTDGDTLSDGDEVANGSDPTDATDPPPPSLPDSSNLLAFYTFDETSGTTAEDCAVADGAQNGEQNQGTVAWNAAGLVGGALDLDGTSSLQTVDPIPQGATAFSISGWVNPRTQGGYKGIFAARPMNWGLNLEGALHGDLRFATGGGSAGMDTPDAIALNEWAHIAITYSSDGAEAVGTGYLNGVVVGTFTTSANGIAATYSTDGPYNIGDDPCCGGREFDGLIDEISVWSVALTDSEIAAIYLNGQNGVGVTKPETVDFKITDIVLNADGSVDLTWNSDVAPGTSYAVLFNTNLTDPVGSWADADDGVASGGATTSFNVPANFLPVGAREVFFKIRLN